MSDRVLEIGGDLDEVAITLRVYADDLDPQWVSDLLGISPSYAARKGDSRISGGRTIRQRVGIWQLELPGTREWVLADAIRTLLSRLPSDTSVWEELAERAHADVFCGLFLARWNRGADLPYELLGDLARRRLALSLDIYSQSSVDDESPI